MFDKFFKSDKKRPEQRPTSPAATMSSEGEFVGDCVVCYRRLHFSREAVWILVGNSVAQLQDSDYPGYCYNCDIELCSQHIRWDDATTKWQALCPRCGHLLHGVGHQLVDILAQKDRDPVAALRRMDALLAKANRYANQKQINLLLEKRSEIEKMGGKPQSGPRYHHGHCTTCGECFLCPDFLAVSIAPGQNVGGYCFRCDIEVCDKHAVSHRPEPAVIEQEWCAQSRSTSDDFYHREVFPNYRHFHCPKCNQRLNDLSAERTRILGGLQTNTPAAIAQLGQLAEKTLRRGHQQESEALRSEYEELSKSWDAFKRQTIERQVEQVNELLRKGDEALAEQRFADAVASFEKALSIYSGIGEKARQSEFYEQVRRKVTGAKAQKVFDEVMKLLLSKRYQAGIELFESSADIMDAIGQLAGQDMMTEGRKIVRGTLESQVVACINGGNQAIQQQNYEDALKFCQEALTIMDLPIWGGMHKGTERYQQVAKSTELLRARLAK